MVPEYMEASELRRLVANLQARAEQAEARVRELEGENNRLHKGYPPPGVVLQNGWERLYREEAEKAVNLRKQLAAITRHLGGYPDSDPVSLAETVGAACREHEAILARESDRYEARVRELEAEKRTAAIEHESLIVALREQHGAIYQSTVERAEAKCARLREQLTAAASQNYCTMCGNTLDGYTPAPPPMPEGWEWKRYNAEILHLIDRGHIVLAICDHRDVFEYIVTNEARVHRPGLYVSLQDTYAVPAEHWPFLGWAITNAERVWTGNVPEVQS